MSDLATDIEITLEELLSEKQKEAAGISDEHDTNFKVFRAICYLTDLEEKCDSMENEIRLLTIDLENERKNK